MDFSWLRHSANPASTSCSISARCCCSSGLMPKVAVEKMLPPGSADISFRISMHFRSRRRLANSLGSGNNPRSEYLRTVSKTGRSAHPFSDKSYINHAAERRTAKLPTHTVIPDSMKHTRSAGKAAPPTSSAMTSRVPRKAPTPASPRRFLFLLIGPSQAHPPAAARRPTGTGPEPVSRTRGSWSHINSRVGMASSERAHPREAQVTGAVGAVRGFFFTFGNGER